MTVPSLGGERRLRLQYLADGRQTAFTFTFPIFSAADLQAWVDDEPVLGGLEVTGVGAAAGGTATFSTAPEAGRVVTLCRGMALERTTSFDDSSLMRARSINAEFDCQTAALQQVADGAARALHLPPWDGALRTELPGAAGRAGRILGFDRDGNVAVYDAASTPLVMAADNVNLRLADAGAVSITVPAALKDLLRTPEWYGAKGDGVTDDTAAVQALLDATPGGGAATFTPGRSYRLVGRLNIPRAMTIRAHGATLLWPTDADGQGVTSTASGITWLGGKLQGPQGTAGNATQIGLKLSSPTEGSTVDPQWASDITVRDVEVCQWGQTGIYLEYVEGFAVEACHVHHCHNDGIAAYSARDGVIRGNRVHDLNPTSGWAFTGVYSYGVIVTKHVQQAAPVSCRIRIEGNHVWSIKGWEGIDTHGGQDIVIAGNTVRDCLVGINVGPAVGEGGAWADAPARCVIADNTVSLDHAANAGARSAQTRAGIGVSGDRTGDVTTWATDIVVRGNTVVGHGSYQTNARDSTAAVLVQFATRASIAGNVIDDAGTVGLMLWQATNVDVAGNVIQGVGGAAPTLSGLASGALAFAANPTDGQTVAINGATITFKTAPSDPVYHCQIGANLAATLATLAASLNASQDGRIGLATYTAGATTLTATARVRGYHLSDSTARYRLNGGTAATPNVDTALAGGSVAGPAAIFVTTSGAGALVSCTGVIRHNLIYTQHAGIVTHGAFPGLFARDNRQLGGGPLHDCSFYSAGSYAADGIGAADPIGEARASLSVGAIAAGSSKFAYVSLLGAQPVASYGMVDVTPDRSLAGLTVQAYSLSNHIVLRFDNPQAGSVTLGTITVMLRARKAIPAATTATITL